MQSTISHNDLMIIVEGAYQMAMADSKFDEAEKHLLKKMMQAGGIDCKELKRFENSHKVDIKELSQKLSSEKARKLFLLTLVGTALADQTLDINEKKMMDDLSQSLKVKTIPIDKMSYENCEEMILSLIVESKIVIDFTGS